MEREYVVSNTDGWGKSRDTMPIHYHYFTISICHISITPCPKIDKITFLHKRTSNDFIDVSKLYCKVSELYNQSHYRLHEMDKSKKTKAKWSKK